jgi:hypothetical protein
MSNQGCVVELIHTLLLNPFKGDHFPPLFCSKNRTFFFTTGSYFSIERGREARGRTIVRKKPVMAMLMRRTAMVRDFSNEKASQRVEWQIEVMKRER